MPSSRIIAQRVQMVDLKTGQITLPWYNFLHDLFELLGAGQSVSSIPTLSDLVDGLQTAPPPVSPPYAMVVGKVVASLDFPSTAANSSSNLTVTIPGAVDGDVVSLGVPLASVPTNGMFFAWVSAANTVTVRFCNNSAAAVDPASGVFRVAVTRG